MSIQSNVDSRRLDQRINLQRKQETRSPSGEPLASFVTVLKNCYAAVDATKVSAAEPYVTDGIRSVSDYTVWIRADVKERFGLRVMDRILWRGRPYDIADIPDQQLRGRLVAMFVSIGKNIG